jgi:phage shock protein PspC (stress-responsive transcriptional regulator)
MKAAISVELDGTKFALDERAFQALRSYLERAAVRLGAHPDRDDVIAGLERSIAAKLAQRAGGHPGIIDEATMQAALNDVGRVEGPGLDDSQAGLADGSRSPQRRLYRLRQGQIAGVCAGLGAYAEIDANIVRLLFVLGALFSAGIVLVVYLVLMFVLPIAHTEAEIADAHGGR